MKRILASFMVFILVLSVPLTAFADRAGAGTSSEGRAGGGHHLGEREVGGHRVGFPDELLELLPEDATYYDYMYINYEESSSNCRFSYALSVKGNGRFRYRTMNYVYKGGTKDEYYSIYLYVFSPLPFEYILARSEFYVDSGNIIRTQIVSSGETALKSNLNGKSVYMFSTLVFTGAGLQSSDYAYYIPKFQKASLPNYLKVPVSSVSSTRPVEFDWYLEESLDFVLDDYGEPDFSPEGDDPLGEYGGDDDGSGTGGGGSGPGGGGSGDDNKPDFDLDFSNIFTLIYTILKALIDFIISCLNMLVEFANLLLEQTGQFAPLIGSIFTFLPEEFITMMLSGIVIIIIIGIVKK